MGRTGHSYGTWSPDVLAVCKARVWRFAASHTALNIWCLDAQGLECLGQVPVLRLSSCQIAIHGRLDSHLRQQGGSA